MRNSLGLSIGATNLVAARDGGPPLTRASTMTLLPNRPPDLGVPPESSGGLLLADFVERVGDPVPLIASDGSRHHADRLVAEALDVMVRTAGNEGPVSDIAATVPAHWRPPVVAALRRALADKPHLCRNGTPLPLVSDATASLTAIQSRPGLPSRGVVALCDFGGSGTSITLADAGDGFKPIGETVRVPEFSGEQIDRAILAQVIRDVSDSAGADPAGTAMMGGLARLREQCRLAKERLSSATATAVVADLPGFRSDIRLNRMELEALIQEPLTGFLTVLDDTLERNRVPATQLAAVATAGGGASIPLITERLSEHLRAAVVTTPQPHATAAAGAALIASRGQVVEAATSMAAVASVPAAAAGMSAGEPSSTFQALAWSEDAATDADEVQPYVGDDYDEGVTDARPPVHFEHGADESEDEQASRSRQPLVLFALAAVAAIAAAGALFFVLRSSETETTPVETSATLPPASGEQQPSTPAVEPPPPAPPPVQDAPTQPTQRAPQAPAPRQRPPASGGTPAPAPPSAEPPPVEEAPPPTIPTEIPLGPGLPPIQLPIPGAEPPPAGP